MLIFSDIGDAATGLHILERRMSISPPAYQSKNDMNPTLLVSWFCTILSLVIIAIRLMGRWVRNEMLFIDDKIMFYSILPLLARMAFVHVILIWGTNNTDISGLDDLQIYERTVGSKLVLPARILYATYIWIAKVAVLEFLQKVVSQSWHKSYETAIRLVYAFLALTYIAVVISTLAECQPFNHYWQVVPDPGTACRATPAQLITMGVCEIATDLVLVICPIPLVLMSKMTARRKISLIFLFFLSAILIAITAYRVPSTIDRNASQQYRSLLASLEILASTAVANAIVIGSFLRDRGVRKARYRAASVDGSVLSRVATGLQSRTKSVTQNHWGSDEDLVRGVGISLRADLRHSSATADTSNRPVPLADPLPPLPEVEKLESRRPTLDTSWGFSTTDKGQRRCRSSIGSSISSTSTDIKLRELQSQFDEPISPGTTMNPQKLSFFETGQALDNPFASNQQRPTLTAGRSQAFLSDVGGLLEPPPRQDDEISEIPSEPQQNRSRTSLHPRSARQFLRSASPFRHRTSSDRSEVRRSRTPSRSPLQNPSKGPEDLDFSDAGGLLK